ncbi:MAG TPA: hypothetical protein PLD23_04210 [Armatimonadota bacterium]|nr:hypothetical protein [Armatimonadota bacterium]
MQTLRERAPFVLASAMALAVMSGCSGGLFGTGATPYTRELRIVVVANVSDSLTQIPVPGAVVSVSQYTSNQPKVGTTSGGTTTTVTQTMSTDPSGQVLFRVEPGESYRVSVSADGYSSATLIVSPSYFGPFTIVRSVTLAPSAAAA